MREAVNIMWVHRAWDGFLIVANNSAYSPQQQLKKGKVEKSGRCLSKAVQCCQCQCYVVATQGLLQRQPGRCGLMVCCFGLSVQ